MTARPPAPRRARIIAASILASVITLLPLQFNQLATLPSAHAYATQTSTQVVLSEDAPDESFGEKIAAKLQKLGWSDEAVIFTVSALPLIESRGGVPLACLLKMQPLKTLGIVLAGNLTPIVGLLALMRVQWVRNFNKFFLERAKNKLNNMGSEGSKLIGLILFVGIPLPGTGAYTGSLMAFVMELPFWNAVGVLALGILMSEVIMLALCELGLAGAIIAGVSLLAIGGTSIYRSERARRAALETGEGQPLVQDSTSSKGTDN